MYLVPCGEGIFCRLFALYGDYSYPSSAPTHRPTTSAFLYSTYHATTGLTFVTFGHYGPLLCPPSNQGHYLDIYAMPGPALSPSWCCSAVLGLPLNLLCPFLCLFSLIWLSLFGMGPACILPPHTGCCAQPCPTCNVFSNLLCALDLVGVCSGGGR